MTASTPALMIQATGSNAGKSTIVTGLARLLVRRGLRVAPFKPQNMSNNAAVAVEGGEIGRAQFLQARAARVPPSIHMNPVLLKPETDRGSQVIVQGRRAGSLQASRYLDKKAELLPAVLESFARVATHADIVLVEGAGSPAEVNLRAGDIANMGFAAACDIPVVLVGDIDRGGVIASIVGTHAVITADERDRIKGFIINKFRGDPTLFRSGEATIAQVTGWPSLGLVPWLPAAAWLPAEDALDLQSDGGADADALTIAVPMLSRVANFDDLDPLRMEPKVKLIWVRPGEPIPAAADVVILPGTKSTIGDLTFLRAQGWDIDIKAHVRRGGHVLGICGGYQLLGTDIRDLGGFDGAPGSVEGLALLNVTTTMSAEKATTAVSGTHRASGAAIAGYEIHLGRTEGPDCDRPVLTVGSKAEGASSADGRVQGTHVHGLFASDAFRRAWLADFGKVSTLAYEQKIESAIDALADHLEANLDIERLLAIARSRQATNASAA